MVEGMRLILNDGTIIEDGRCGISEGFLWLWFNGYTMQQVAMIFFDPDKIAHIVFQYGEMQDVFDGYTICRTININSDGQISVCLVKEG